MKNTPIRNEGVSIIERSQPNGVKPKMRQRKLRSSVNWQGALKLREV